MKLRLFLILNLLYSFCLAQTEQDNLNEPIAQTLNKNVYEPNYFSMILGLFLVVGLIYLTGYIYQKMIKVNLVQKDNESNRIDIVSTTPLGQNKNLHIIKVNDKHILIGATQYNITYIKDVDMEK